MIARAVSIVTWPFRQLYYWLGVRFLYPILYFLVMSFTWLVTFGTAGIVVLAGMFFTVASKVPEPQTTYRFLADTASKVSYSNGEKAFRIAREYRIFVPYEDMPEIVIQGFLALPVFGF